MVVSRFLRTKLLPAVEFTFQASLGFIGMTVSLEL